MLFLAIGIILLFIMFYNNYIDTQGFIKETQPIFGFLKFLFFNLSYISST